MCPASCTRSMQKFSGKEKKKNNMKRTNVVRAAYAALLLLVPLLALDVLPSSICWKKPIHSLQLFFRTAVWLASPKHTNTFFGGKIPSRQQTMHEIPLEGAQVHCLRLCTQLQHACTLGYEFRENTVDFLICIVPLFAHLPPDNRFIDNTSCIWNAICDKT